MNRADSFIMIKLLEEAGLSRVNSPEEADVIILNTCNVKTPTEHKMINRARYLSEKAPLIAAGCMAKSQPERLRPFSRALVAPRAVNRIVDAVQMVLSGGTAEFLRDEYVDKAKPAQSEVSDVIGIVPIAEGCLGTCTYCITRLARGRLRSFPLDSVIRAVKELVGQGKVEIWLTAQDTGVYGWDMGTNLADLLGQISKIPGDFRVRVGMMTPDSALQILHELLRSYESDKVYDFFHLPVQSGSNRVLKIMGRKYTSEDFLNLVKEIRSWNPEATISTDVIVGFPTETEEDFQRTLEVIRLSEPDVVNISKFGARPKTPASKMEQLPERVKKERAKILMELVNEIKLKRNRRYLGEEVLAVVTEKGPKGFQGRTQNYKPVALKGKVDLGRPYIVKIEEVKGNYLVGKVVREVTWSQVRSSLQLRSVYQV